MGALLGISPWWRLLDIWDRLIYSSPRHDWYETKGLGLAP